MRRLNTHMNAGWLAGISLAVLFVSILYGKAEAQSRDRYALVIGISQYQYLNDAPPITDERNLPERQSLPHVQFADADARAFAAMLLHHSCGGFPSGNIVVLTNQQATRQGIMRAVRELKLKIRATDLLYFYFAGHGVISAEGIRYLLPYDAQAEYPVEQGLPMNGVIPMLRGQLNPRNLVCFVDACYSSAIIGDVTESVEEYDLDDRPIGVPPASIAGLFSSGPVEQSYENPGSGHGVFTEYLLKAMQGEADRISDCCGDGRVTGFEAYLYILDNVGKDVNRRGRQMPMQICMSADFVLSADSTWRRTVRYADTASLSAMDSARAHLLAGNSAFNRRDLYTAKTEYKMAIGWFDTYDTAHYRLGMVLAATGNTIEATDAFRRALQLNPSLAQAHYSLGAMLLKSGRAEEAMPELLLATALEPKDADALHALARTEVALGDLESAANHFDQLANVVNESSRKEEARNNAAKLRGSAMYIEKGRLLASKGSLKNALLQFYDALRVNPNAAPAYYEIGAIHYANGDFEDARDYLKHAVQLDMRNVEARYLLGLSYEELEKPVEAQIQYRAALKAKPEGPLSPILQERIDVLRDD